MHKGQPLFNVIIWKISRASVTNRLNIRYDERKQLENSMQEIFVEKIVKRKKQTSDIVLVVLMILSGLSLTLVLFLLPVMFEPSLFLVSIIATPGIIYFLYRMITGLSKEYEYSFTNDLLTIDRIVARKRRKNLFNGSCKDFAFAAPMADDDFDRYLSEKCLHLDVRSGNFTDDDWFIMTKSGGSSLMILIELDDRMIQVMRRYNPRAVKRISSSKTDPSGTDLGH